MDNGPEKAWWQPALAVFGEITGWLVAPILGSLWLGKYLDQQFDSDPWFYLGLTAVAFIITIIGLVRIGSKYIKQMESEKREKNKKIEHEPNNTRNS